MSTVEVLPNREASTANLDRIFEETFGSKPSSEVAPNSVFIKLREAYDLRTETLRKLEALGIPNDSILAAVAGFSSNDYWGMVKESRAAEDEFLHVFVPSQLFVIPDITFLEESTINDIIPTFEERKAMIEQELANTTEEDSQEELQKQLDVMNGKIILTATAELFNHNVI